MQIVTGFKDAGNRQFFRQDYIAQFVDYFFFLPFGVLEFFDGIENLAEIAR